MAIIKRYIKKNGQKKVCYQVQVYVKGFRLKCKTFKNKTEACAWHDKQKEQLLKNPSEFYQEKESIFFAECFKQYLEEAFPLLKKAAQQGYVPAAKLARREGIDESSCLVEMGVKA